MAPLPEAETLDIPALADSYARGDIDLLCVLGPTASGKTKYAVQLARDLDRFLRFARNDSGLAPNNNSSVIPNPGGVKESLAEILSADSRQVYTGMDIGTGKDLREYGEVPYHLIDLVPAGSKFNIYQYQAAFAEAYADVRSRGAIPILCGGSGLYIESVTRAYKFDKENGVPAERLPQKTFYIGTLVSREERVERIDRRLDERLEEGLVEEVRGLLDSGIPPEGLLWYGLEYKFVTQYILGDLSYDEMHILLANAIHQFAKRQMTWFRGMERDGVRIHWVRP
ncbi:MAG: tRNA (adenosine(37)-N6)-dimethylallyltransferase MiaA [Bacteroidales bacterium]|nr:tRNA (adenosine(37)-N6)-dimethylallyltransferase MiaA [Bacteroidales bacterium]